MNVTTTSTGKLNATLTVEIKQDDYQKKVEKVLADYRKKANIPGFRPGMVPVGLIKKQYGKSVLVEEVNHLLQHAITDHIRDEKLDILGNPLPIEDTNLDWDNAKDFSFSFELGLAPEFDLNISDKTKVPYYKIVADKKMVDRYVSDYAKRFGAMSQPEAVQDDCLLKGQFTELSKDGSPLENGLNAEGTFSLESLDAKKTIKALTGLAIGDIASFNVNKAFKDDFNIANVLGTTAEALKAGTGEFQFQIEEITLVTPAEVNQELFDKVFGEGTIKGEKEFKERIKADAENMFVGESNRKFYEDVKEVVLGKSKFDLPDEFLKKWMLSSQERPTTPEEIETQYPDMKDSLKWQLVESKVVKQHNVEVKQEELIDFTKQMIVNQMQQYGQAAPMEQLDSIAENVLQNKEEAQKLTDQLYSEKLLQFYKTTVKLNEKEVNFDEFVKMLSKK